MCPEEILKWTLRSHDNQWRCQGMTIHLERDPSTRRMKARTTGKKRTSKDGVLPSRSARIRRRAEDGALFLFGEHTSALPRFRVCLHDSCAHTVANTTHCTGRLGFAPPGGGGACRQAWSCLGVPSGSTDFCAGEPHEPQAAVTLWGDGGDGPAMEAMELRHATKTHRIQVA